MMASSKVTREAIITSVNSHQGLKGVDLALHVMGIINPIMFKHAVYARQLDLLVTKGEIVELNYVLPQMDYKIKSIYFPKGTEICTPFNNRSDDNVPSVQG